MSALAIERYVDLEKAGISTVRDLARDPDYYDQDKAAREYVTRLLDLEVERRLDILHRNTGYPPVSATAKVGENPGGGVRGDSMVASYERGQGGTSYWHKEAQRVISKLSVRSQVAILIRHVKSDTRLEGEWSATYDQIAARMPYYCRMLGFGPHPFEPEIHKVWLKIHKKIGTNKKGETEVIEREGTEIIVPEFKNGDLIKYAAKDGAKRLIWYVMH